MTDIRHKKKLVSELDIGMFVCELDIPWLGTPFLLEGLLIENDEQISTLRNLCQFVYIDHAFSTGSYYLNPNQPTNPIHHEMPSGLHNQSSHANQLNATRTKSSNPQTNDTKFSFFEILKEIKASNQALSASENQGGESENVLLYVSAAQSIHTQANNQDETTSLAAQIKSDFSNFISSLKYWRLNQNKSRFKFNAGKEISEINDKINSTTGFSNTLIEERIPVEQEIATIYPLYEQSQIATREIFEALAQDQRIDLSKVDDALNGMVESIERNPDALIWLSKLKQTDNYSYNHALNVSITLMAMASFLSLPKKQVKELGLAGLLQDIGKVKIPIKLLQKEEKITAEEFELLKKHVDYALELLDAQGNMPNTVILTISQHHERIDGSGYPFSLSGKQISLAGQMAGLVDTYCAITSSKPYAKGIYNQIALEQMQALRDVKFSGLLIDQLVQFMGMYPVSTLVELNTGEVAVVVQQNSVRRLLPRVMVLLNPDKSKNQYPATIDLINSPTTPSGETYRIIRGLPPNSFGLDISNYFG